MSSPPVSPPLSRPFLNAMSRLANSVAIATTDGTAGKAGTTISTLSPVSAEEPPSLLICLHHKTAIAQKIQRNKILSVNLLNDTQQELAQLFAGKLSPQNQNKFNHTQHLWQKTHLGTWHLQDALCIFDCQMIKTIRCQSHFVVISKVLNIKIGTTKTKPLLYSSRDYRMLADLPVSAS